MKVPEKYEPIDANEFERFDKLVGQVLSVPYEQLKRSVTAHERKKARKKRAKGATTRNASSHGSEEGA